MQVGAFHWFLRPAGDFRDDPGCHIRNVAVLTVQQVEERPPDGFVVLGGVLVEYFDTFRILLNNNSQPVNMQINRFRKR